MRMRLLVGAVLLLFVAGGTWFAVFRTGRANDRPREGSGHNIVAFGDSLIQGAGASPGMDLPAILSRKLGLPVINAGRSGDTAGTALERLENDVLARNPRVVIVLVGGNDILRGIPLTHTVRDLRAIIERVHARGATVLLIGVRGNGVFTDRHEEAYRKLANEMRVSFVPNILEGIFGHEELMADVLHPNGRGYEMMADRIAPVLREMLSR